MTAPSFSLMDNASPLGIIAGRGALPHMIVDAASAQGRPVVVAAVKGWGEAGSFASPAETFPIDHVGAFAEYFREHGVRQIVMGGTVHRPPLFKLRPDALGRQLMARVVVAALKGDDALLKEVISFAKEQGFELVQADKLLPSHVAKARCYTKEAPEEIDEESARHGFELLKTMSPYDVGQSVVVAGGRVLAIEGPEGTDAMLARAGEFVQDGVRAVLVKSAKAEQSMEADIPAVGKRTIEVMREHGIIGLAVAAGSVLLLEQERMMAEADMHEIWVQGFGA